MRRNHEKIVVIATGLGANVGGYQFAKDESNFRNEISLWTLGALIGGGAGMFLGYISPFALPALIVSVPSYALIKYRSSLQESQQKAGKQEAQMK